MQSRQAGRVAWIVAAGVLALAVAIWLLTSDERTEAGAPAPLAREEVAEPASVLPEPAEAKPLAPAVERTGDAVPPPVADVPVPTPAADAATSAHLRVLVVDPSSRPLEGARVVSRSKLPRLLTDAEGVALFEVRPGETLRVAATHPDFRLATGSVTIDEQPGSLTELRLQLAEGLQVCLEVQARDGRPIEGACVRIREGWGIVDTKDAFVGSAEELLRADDFTHLEDVLMEERSTDAHGRCCVNGVRSGPITVHADAVGFVAMRSQRFDVDADGGDLGVIVLESAVTLGGVVEDATGPVPGALVEYRSLGYARTTTDGEGHFVVDGQPKSPARLELHASHPERGQYYDTDITFAEQPVHVVLVPDIDVSFELSDAQTHQPVDGPAKVERQVPKGILINYRFPITLDVEKGRLDLPDLGYFVETVVLRLEGYDVVEVPMATIVGDADRVLELELTRPVTLLVRVRAVGSGELIQEARLSVGQFDVVKGREMQMRYFLLQGARFDAEVGGYVVAESDLGLAGHARVALFAEAKGFAGPSEPVTVALDGQRSSPAEVDLFLKRE